MKQDAVIGNDSHCPFQDDAVISLFIGFVEKKQPKKIILLGDMCDFYQLSRFKKDPERRFLLQKDLDLTCDFLYKLRFVAPKADIHYIQGNHERRLKKYLWGEDEALSPLRSLQLPILLNFNELKIVYHESGYQFGDLYCTHGSIIRKHAGYTAKAEFEKNGCTGITGHSHRDGKFTVRTRLGHFAWWENYCLCALDPEYVEGVANWCQGWSYVRLIDNRPYIEQIPCIDYKYIYGGKMIKYKETLSVV